MNALWAEELSRLVDAEPVDPEVVADALESPETRLLFVGFLRLRAAVREDRYGPSVAFHDRMGRTLQAAERQSTDRRVVLRLVAALIVTALLTGLGVESWRRWRDDRPPRPNRVLRFDASEWTSNTTRSGS